MIDPGYKIKGYTLIELLLAVVLASILMLGLSGVTNLATQTHIAVSEQNKLTRQARFAMQRMTRAVSYSRLLLLPLNDISSTNWLENVREETVPATTPTDDSTQYSAVLAVTVPLYNDLNADGFPDADDDRDGKVDEDLSNDMNYDSEPGIYLIDDDGDGSIDNNNDNNVDQNPASDMNSDGCPGICGVDDDSDDTIDEGSANDDDEDGTSDEDWYNPVVFYLDNGILKERTPVPWDENGIDGITGQDFITSDIAENITRFRVERIPVGSSQAQLIDLTLELTSSVTGESVSLHTQVRMGGGL